MDNTEGGDINQTGPFYNVNVHNVCHGCLSHDRNVAPLEDRAAILLLKAVLGENKQCLYDAVEDMVLCWECTAKLKNFQTFQDQIKRAQTILQYMNRATGTHVKTLSKLAIVEKSYYDLDIKYEYECDNFNINHEQFKITVKYEPETCHLYSDNDNNSDEQQHNEPNESVIEHDTEMTHELTWPLGNKMTTFDRGNKKDMEKTESEMIDVKDYKQNSESVNNSEWHEDIEYNNSTPVDSVISAESYRKYAKLVKYERRDWGSSDTIESNFLSEEFSEKQMEDYFLNKDRRQKTSCEEMPYKCIICTLGYMKEIDLKRHNDLNHTETKSSYKCSHCSKCTPTLEALEHHWRSHSVVYRCKTCLKICKQKYMRYHLAVVHSRAFECNVCRRKFGNLELFAVHYKSTHATYICDYCSLSTTTKVKMEKHISFRHIPYECKECKKTFRKFVYYRKHCDAIHPEKFQSLSTKKPELSFCVECNRQFSTIEKYHRHLRMTMKHGMNKRKDYVQFPCNECGKVFARKENMLYHYNWLHLKKTKYQCDICEQYFARPGGLKVHRDNVHMKVEKKKDKICNYCGKAFEKKSLLESHTLTHTGSRPHKCPYCPADYTQKSKLQTHVKSKHQEVSSNNIGVKKAKRPIL